MCKCIDGYVIFSETVLIDLSILIGFIFNVFIVDIVIMEDKQVAGVERFMLR